jgi:nitrile hydratase subunit alpha
MTTSPGGRPGAPPQLTPEERATVLERHLHDHGQLDDDRVDASIEADERGEGPSPALGAKVIARAWTEPAFRRQLLEDPRAALADYIGDQLVPLVVLEDTPEVHHVIVCTLCSCYPTALLGNAPEWYKSFEYRSRVVREPRQVLAEFGMPLPDDVTIRVVDSTAELRYLVLPLRPPGTEGWPAERLAGLVTRNAMIGTGTVSDGDPTIRS